MSHDQGSEFEQVVELVFQNVQYLLTVSLAPADTLSVEAEHKTDGSRWRGDFTARCQLHPSTLPPFNSSVATSFLHAHSLACKIIIVLFL